MQERSTRRVTAMLDACADILAESGYEGLTTTLVAERAGVAIGSVYQFFPDKRALALALSQRNVEVFLTRVTTMFSERSFPTWWDGVEAVIDTYLDMHRAVPGFSVVQFGDEIGVRLIDPDRDNTMAIAENLTTLLAGTFKITPDPELPFVVANAVEFGDALFRLAFRRDPAGDQATLDDAKWLMRIYLDRHVPD